MIRVALGLLVTLGGHVHAEVPLIGCDKALRAAFSAPPHPRTGLIAVGLDARAKALGAAYANGIFPMETSADDRLQWLSPPRRGVLFLDEVVIPRSDRKILRRLAGSCEVLVDQHFDAVITACSWPRGEGRGVWLTPRLVKGYQAAFAAGDAHSLVTVREGHLTGGLFGMHRGYFSADSMFHVEDNAAKIALHVLITHLRERGHTFLDVQQAFPASADRKQNLATKWGARTISRADFLDLIRREQRRGLTFAGP